MNKQRHQDICQKPIVSLSSSQIPRNCRFCCSPKITVLPAPNQQSMRSDGLIINEPLLKIGCLKCGTVHGINSQSDIVYQRSKGNSPFDYERHRRVAAGLLNCFRELLKGENLRIIEIGAASFQTSLTLKHLKPTYEITALERHPENTPITDEILMVEKDFFQYKAIQKFDLCFSNQVIEHFNDPILFLERAKRIITKNGFVVVCCPTFSVASNELLFSDHLTHFTLDTMSICAKHAGLELVYEKVSDWDPLTHIYVLRHSTSKNKKIFFSNHEYLFRARLDLILAWKNEDTRITDVLSNHESILVYGAGEFTQLIRAYLPNTWKKVDKIVVDNLDGIRIFDKKIVDLNVIKIDSSSIFLMGAHKESHSAILKKLTFKGISKNNIVNLLV